MEIKISRWAIFWKGLFGGKEAVFQYLLDIANEAVSHIPDATKDELSRLYASIGDVRCRIASLDWLVPSRWVPQYTAVLRCFDEVYAALGDGKVTADEIDSVVAAFKDAYNLFKYVSK